MGPPNLFSSSLVPVSPPTPPPSRSPLYPPLPSLTSFGAAYVKLCGLSPPSLDRTTVAAVSSSLHRRKYKVRFDVSMSIKQSIIFSDTAGAFRAKVAV